MKYKVLVENDKYRLIMERGCDYNYVVLFKGRRGFSRKKRVFARSGSLMGFNKESDVLFHRCRDS